MSADLEHILANGNHPIRLLGNNRITCVDGFTASVIAGEGAHCSPRPGFGVSADYPGPYFSVEVGYPSARPEPWDETWAELAENSDEPTRTVYGWVPADTIRALIALHGGAA